MKHKHRTRQQKINAQKRNEQRLAKKKQVEDEKIKSRDSIMISSIISSVFLLLFGIFTILSFKESDSNKYGYWLAIWSLCITLSFEIYEWIFLFYKNIKNKHTLMPLMLTIAILACIIMLHLNNKIEFFLMQHTNDICFGTLSGYAISIIARTLIADIFVYRKQP